MMILNGEEGLECEVHVDGIRLEHVSEFIYLGCVLDESCNHAQMGQNVVEKWGAEEVCRCHEVPS